MSCKKESASPVPFFVLFTGNGFRMKFRIFMLWAAMTALVVIPFLIFGEDINRWILDAVDSTKDDRITVALLLFSVLALDIFFPVPSCLVSTLCAVLLGPWLGFSVSFSAMCTSAAIGYLIGLGCAPLAGKLMNASEESMDSYSDRMGAIYLLLLRPVPVLSECSAVYAGMRRVAPSVCILWLGLGNAVVSAVYAVVGALGRSTDSPLPAFGAALLLSGACYALGKLKGRSCKRREYDKH